MKIKRFNILCAFLGSIAFMASCQEEEFISTPVKVTPAEDGSEIIFGARAGFENSNPKTRTHYSGKDYKHGTKTYERIDWVYDIDAIEVYSYDAFVPSATTDMAHTSFYNIKNSGVSAGDTLNGTNTDHQHSYAYLAPLDGVEANLSWNGDKPHTFYALYPSKTMFMQNGQIGTEIIEGIKIQASTNSDQLDNLVVHGLLPIDQSPTSGDSIYEKTENNWYIAPDMRYAYMVAKSVEKRDAGSVSLTFVPLVTAVEIQLTFPDDEDGTSGESVTISDIFVSGDGTRPIVGSFTTSNLVGWDGESYIPCDVSGVNEQYAHITTRKMDASTGIASPIVIQEGGSITFTIFMLSGSSDETIAENLKIEYSESGGGTVSKTLTGANIKGHVKTRIKNLHLPGDIDLAADRWMSQIKDPENTLISGLSIPGAGGAFSASHTDAEYKQQDLTFEQLWDVGIRAFEFSCDRPDDGTTSLGTMPVRINKTTMTEKDSEGNTQNILVESVITRLLDKVLSIKDSDENPTETAVAIITYQPEGYNSTSRNRCSEAFAMSLHELYKKIIEQDEYNGKIIAYTPSLTLEEAKGKLMILARINQRDEAEPTYNERNDYYSTVTQSTTIASTNFTNARTLFNDNDVPIVLIDGCGTAKDRWGARGYKIIGTDNQEHPANDIGDDGDYFMEQYMTEDYIDVSNHSNIVKGDADFTFDTSLSSTTEGSYVQCYYQDWARVVDRGENKNETMVHQSWYLFWTSTDFYWFHTYDDKLADVTETFNKAIDGDLDDKIIINSLSGYLTVSGTGESVTPYYPDKGWYGGNGGNIAGLANKLNPAFYNVIYNSGMSDRPGHTGIVLMDKIQSKDSPTSPSYLLPGLIIANNFK